MEELIDFDMPKNESVIIKVVGVGGGGNNAVNHMFQEGIQDVSYLVCNTDRQALQGSPIPSKLVLGPGLGAGNKPDNARALAEASQEEIKQALSDDTKMVFITAGMGGGTGTGAAPVVAGIARSLGILTVGIVTIPFSWEGNVKINQAMRGVEAMSRNVDALLVINNDLLSKIYPDLTAMNGFKKADDTLLVAAKSIAEIITVPGYINLDFADVNTTLKDGGVAVMSAGYGHGNNRVMDAMNSALHSPLLNNADVYKARKILFNICCSSQAEIKFEEMDQIKEFMSKFEGSLEEVIWGIAYDETLEDKLKVTLLASGFGVNDVPVIKNIKTELSREEKAKAEEEFKKIETMKEHYYGQASHAKRACQPFILDDHSWDDEAIVERLLSEPANRRGK